MEFMDYRVNLEVSGEGPGVFLEVKRGDSGRRLLVTLTQDGFPLPITEDCYGVFSARKPDGTEIFNGCTIENGFIGYTLTQQTLAAPGKVQCEIRLYGAGDKLITSAGFWLLVAEALPEGETPEVSQPEVDALTALISDAAGVIDQGNQVNTESKEMIRTMEENRAELEKNIADARASAQEAKLAAEAAGQSCQAADSAAGEARAAAAEAAAAQTAASVSQAAAEAAAVSAGESGGAAAEAAETARAAEAAAKQYAQSIDPEQLDGKIAQKADDLYFDSGTSLLYLTSEGQIIGSGVQVATSGGGSGGTLSYTIALQNLLDSRVITVAEGNKVELRFSYTSQDEEGVDDGPGIGRIIVGNATRQTFTAVQGENTVDVTGFLAAGSNVVKVQVENSEGAKKTLSYTVTVAAAYLASSFDASSPFTGDIPFIYTPTGIAEKTVHFELDGRQIGTALVTASGRQQSYTIPAQSHGSHSLKVWFECQIQGTTVTSNALYYALMCLEDGNTTPIIAVSAQLLGSVEQYTNIVKKYRVYIPGNLTATITLEAGGETVANLTVDRTEQTWTYRPMEVGDLVQAIRCGETAVSWTQTVTESSIRVEAETEALALHLSSYGRSNNEENPGVWESGNVACQFQNFNFVSDGWKQDDADNTVLRVTGDARLYIPYKMFAYDFRTTGKTIEFELATRDVLNYDAVVINCFSGERGFTITAQQLKLVSEQSQMGTRYKEDEHIRVTFVAQKKSENRLLLCYINGIMSGAVQYPEDDDFSQADPVGITVGSNECTTDLYNIRVYDNDLTRYQVLDNWIADTQNPEERVNRYLRNQIYDAYGRVTISQLPNDLCYMILECSALPQFKGDKKTCSGSFVDLAHPERSFTFQNAEIDVQGTSSQYYYRKNYKIKFKGGFILSDGSTVTAYRMNDGAVPVSTFTMKADVASSEGYYNVVTAKLFNKYHPFKMPAQEEDPRVRYSIDGFPMVIFWDNGEETSFLGKYNFNNDKGTPEPFGLDEGDERWEVLQNGTARVGFHSADFSGSGWKEDFEGNYPDGNTDLTNLQPMCAWVTSTETDQEKFSAELTEHFVEEAVIYYYVFTEAFLCMDQREKNVLWRYIKALERWLADYYDADSIIGHNNQAQPVFDYWMEDIDYTESGDPVYNGQNSTFWKNLRDTRSEEIKAEWHRLRDAGFSYASVMAAFEEHKGKWPEAIYNEDMQAKCLDALVVSGDGTYLPFLRGDKWAWTQWWLYNRFRYLDSKYEYGTSLENKATIRTNVMQNITATYYMKLYGHCYYNAEHIAERVEKDVPCEFVSNATGAEDRVIGLNDADMITDLGDLSGHQVELIDLSKMVRLKSLKLGDGAASYGNNALTSVTFGNNILLRKVDIRNCIALTQAPDLSGCANIEEVYLEGTAVTGVSLPNGGILKVLHLPETVTNLTLRNQRALTDFVLPDGSGITTLRLENNSNAVDPFAIFGEIPEQSRVRLIGLNKEFEDSAELIRFLTRLDVMRGLDENGNNADTAQVSGYLHVAEVNALQVEVIEAAREKYPSLTIEYDTVRKFVVKFYNGDTLLQTVTEIDYGGSAAYTGTTPTKEAADASEEWRFLGWDKDTSYVTGDMDVYAVFKNVNYMTIKLIEGRAMGDYTNDRITVLGARAFTGANVTGISLPNVATAGFTHYNSSFSNPLVYADLPELIATVQDMFKGCSQLTSVNIPKVTKVEVTTFYNASSLKEIVLPSVTQINNWPFEGSGLEKIDLYCHITAWKDFRSARKLTALILRSSELCSATSSEVCYDTPIASGTGYIYVPAALVDSYKAATNWSQYADQFRSIEDYPDICG